MKINVFGKKRESKEGRKFMTYFSTLVTKAGEEVTVSVKFREECGEPKKTPCCIEFNKKNANLSTEKYEDCGEEKEKKVLWVTDFTESEYVDTSLDDFE